MPRLTQAEIEAIEERARSYAEHGFRSPFKNHAPSEVCALLTEIKALQADRDRMVEALDLVRLRFNRPETYFPAKCGNDECGFLASSEVFNLDGSEDSDIYCPKCGTIGDEHDADLIIDAALQAVRGGK